MKLILIGGVPRAGKTTLAKQISDDLSIPWLSTDALEAIAHQYTPTEHQEKLFPKSAMRRKTNRNNDEFYAAYTICEILDAYYTQAETVSAAIQSLARYAHKNDHDYIVEGYHVTPQLLGELRDEGIVFSAVMLVNSAPEKALERSCKSNTKNDWVRDQTQHEATYDKICAGIKAHSNKLIEDAHTNHISYQDTASNFETTIKQVRALLIK